MILQPLQSIFYSRPWVSKSRPGEPHFLLVFGTFQHQ
uniref:Uncharacterized protein n=1 Tax=Anguilla anguilla TaxID=7936 RepID=A0A0E9T1F7_ANGAN